MLKVGDLVKSNSHGTTIFCVMGFRADDEGKCVAVLKAIYNQTFIVAAPIEDLKNVLPNGKL
ncbi:MAG: hypothetical protein GX318_08690 [Clostridia bacterium]|nr:hypothetical protein [Clostridia bacterium]